MSRFLLIVAVLVGLWWWLSQRRRDLGRPPTTPSANPGQPSAMVACAHCGLHLPQADAVQDAQQRPYCSETHRLAGPQAADKP